MGKESSDELVPGTLAMLILKTLSGCEAMHGYAIANAILQSSSDVLRVEEGALYPALHRLEVRGLLRSKWGFSENNRRAKYYSLTAAGRRELQREASAWDRVSAAIARVMKTT
jgi:PadR family transcriptional regulator, regulatory protein PadR